MKPLVKLGGLAALVSGLVPGLVTGSFAQTALPPSLRLTSGVDTSKPGFLVRTVQVEGIDNGGSVVTSERELNGDLGPNIANLADPNYTYDATRGFFIVNAGLNFRHDAGVDSDNGVLVGPDYVDAPIPGLPGITGSSEQAVSEAIAFLEFPAAGTYEFGVASDDSFKLTVGINPRDRFATVLRQVSGERAMTETRVILVNVTEPGIYPFRCLWANRTGATGWEWFLFDSAGNRVAVGDSTNSVKSYHSGPLRPYISSVFPDQGAVGVSPTVAVVANLRDDSIAVDGSTVSLALISGTNGPAVPGAFSLTKSGTQSTATFTPTAALELGALYTATLKFTDAGTPPLSRTNTWRFRASTATIAAGAAIPEAQVDKTKAGFRLFAHQADGTTFDNGASLNNIRNQLEGLEGENLADLSAADANGYFYFNTPANSVINLNNFFEVVEKGNFTSTNGFPDLNFPGTPGNGGLDWTADNLATEITTTLHFPTAGSYTLGIFGIDSFSVAIGDGKRGPKDLFATVLADFDGDITENYLFSFFVPTAGYYPVRLIHNIGIKQGDLEFFSADADGSNIKLINAAGGLKAYLPTTAGPAYVRNVSPGVNIAGMQDLTIVEVLPNATVSATLVDDGTTISPSSTSLKVDGAGTSTATKNGKITTVTFTRTADFAPASAHTATLVYTDSAGTTVTNEWDFEIVEAFIPDKGRSFALGTEEPGTRGFKVRTAQLPIGFVSGENGSVTKSEAILAGLLPGANDVDFSDTTYPRDGEWWRVDTINFGPGTQGTIKADAKLPGIPGKSGRTDHYAAEAITYIEMPKAGLYQFSVHSDDSPRIMQQEEQSFQFGAIVITSPASLAGKRIGMSATRTSVGSGFGADLPTKEPLVLNLVAANPILANAALVNAAQAKDSAVLIQRGAVAFGLKAVQAKAAGAKAVIIFNDGSGDRPDRPPIFMGGTAEGVDIPCLFINYRDGTNLVAELAKGPITVSLQDNPEQQALVPNDGYLGGWTYSVFVDKPAIYPFRFVSGNGGGDYSMEWTVVKPDGSEVLLNSTEDVAALKTFRAVKPPAVVITGTPPAGFAGATLTNIVIDETAKTITADLPASGDQAYLTISPFRVIRSVEIVGGKLVVRFN
jgi:hypothetical protein